MLKWVIEGASKRKRRIIIRFSNMHAFLKISLHPRSGATVGTLRPRGFRALEVVDVSTERVRGAKSYGGTRYEKDQDEGAAKNKECKYKVDWGGFRVGGAYKMGDVQCTHPPSTRNSSSNAAYRGEDSENSAAQYVLVDALLSSFSTFTNSLPSSLFHYFIIYLQNS